MAATKQPCSRHCTSRHYRLAASKMRLWDQPGTYLGDFFARAGLDWHHNGWDFRKVIAAGAAKVHLDVQFTRYRVDNSDWLLSLVVDRHQGRRTLGPSQRGRALRISLHDRWAAAGSTSRRPHDLGPMAHHRPSPALIDRERLAD